MLTWPSYRPVTRGAGVPSFRAWASENRHDWKSGKEHARRRRYLNVWDSDGWRETDRMRENKSGELAGEADRESPRNRERAEEREAERKTGNSNKSEGGKIERERAKEEEERLADR